MAATRRRLKFDSLGEVRPDVERLLRGHVTVGRWSLGQILGHLALSVRASMDGVPEKFPWPVRRLVGPVVRRVSFRLRWIPEGVRVPAVYLPQPGLDAGREAECLWQAIERFTAFAGPFEEHPLFGRLSRAGWEQFHRLHCAHHLSFAVLTGGEGKSAAAVCRVPRETETV